MAEIGNPYISAARSILLRKALAADADVIVLIDHDMGWEPKALPVLLDTPGDVVAGTYRFKKDAEEYMGALFSDQTGRPLLREDGCICADRVPAGFLKITRKAVERFIAAYPHLVYGRGKDRSVDLFNHGAHGGVWYGEDYAFCRNWIAANGEIHIVPDLDIDHYARDKDSRYKVYPGNFHRFLLKQPQPDVAPLQKVA